MNEGANTLRSPRDVAEDIMTLVKARGITEQELIDVVTGTGTGNAYRQEPSELVKSGALGDLELWKKKQPRRKDRHVGSDSQSTWYYEAFLKFIEAKLERKPLEPAYAKVFTTIIWRPLRHEYPRFKEGSDHQKRNADNAELRRQTLKILWPRAKGAVDYHNGKNPFLVPVAPYEDKDESV